MMLPANTATSRRRRPPARRPRAACSRSAARSSGSVRSVGWLVGADRAADAGDAPPPQLYNRDG